MRTTLDLPDTTLRQLKSLAARRGTTLKPGVLSGIFFVLVFGSRFFIEFLKTPQASWLDASELQMGQYLSIPFVCLGLALIFTPVSVMQRLRLVKKGNSDL